MESEWKWENGEWINRPGMAEVTGLGESERSFIAFRATPGIYYSTNLPPLERQFPPTTDQTFIGIPPRWTCVYCKSSLPNERDECPNCGGPRYETNA